MVLGGGGVCRGRRRLGRLCRLGSSSEPVEIGCSRALSAIVALVGAGLLAWRKAGGGLGRDLLGEAMGSGRGIPASCSSVLGLVGTDSLSVGYSDSASFFLFGSGAFTSSSRAFLLTLRRSWSM